MSNKPSASAHVTCRFSVPPERVFDAWLKPEQVRRWIFVPKPGERVMRVEIDPRVGGSFTYVLRRDGEGIWRRRTGWVQLEGATLQQVDLTVRTREFTAMNTLGIQTMINTDLAARGSLQAMTATGTVTVPRLRVVINKLPGTGPRAVQPWELTVNGVYGPGPEAVAAGDEGAVPPLQAGVPLPFLQADIRVEIPRNAWIHGPGTVMEMSGDIQISKQREQPFVLNGGITIVRGVASAYGKRFVMKQRQVTFTGSPEINPQLDITVTPYGLELSGGNSRRREGPAATAQYQQHARTPTDGYPVIVDRGQDDGASDQL